MSNRDARPLYIKPLSAFHDAAIEEIHEGRERWGIPMLLGLHTGLRRNEIGHFTDDWIEEEDGGKEIQTPKLVECTLKEGGCHYCNQDISGGPDGHFRPKTGKGEQRSIPIFETFYDYYLEETRETELLKWLDHWFTANDVGWGYEPKHLRIVIRHVANRRYETIKESHEGTESLANGKKEGKEEVLDIIPHDLRATWATQCVRNGIQDATIMDWAGWETAAMLNKYAGFIGDPDDTEKDKYENGKGEDESDSDNADVDMSEVIDVYSAITEGEQINPANYDNAVLEAAYEMVNAS
jgi:integrase